MTPIGDFTRLAKGFEQYAAALECSHCHDINIVHFHASRNNPAGSFASIEGGWGTLNWFPKRVSAPEFDQVPEHIATPAREAYVARDAGAPRAAIMTARAVIEAVAKDHKVIDGTLNQKINELAKQGIILDRTREAAHALRGIGNEMAHGDFETSEVTEEDVEDVLTIMEDLIEQLYVGAARTARLRARRQG